MQDRTGYKIEAASASFAVYWRTSRWDSIDLGSTRTREDAEKLIDLHLEALDNEDGDGFMRIFDRMAEESGLRCLTPDGAL